MRVCVAGVGVAGSSHVFDLVSDERFEVVGVCAANPAHAKAVGDEFGVPALASTAQLLALPGLEGVVLATPPQVTPLLLREASSRGLIALVEKPGAVTAAALRAVTGARAAVAYNRRYQGHVGRAGTELAAGTVGAPRSVVCRWRAPFRERYTTAASHRPSVQFGEGVLLDTACHIVDTLRFLGFAQLSVVSAELVAVDAARQGPDVEARLGLLDAGDTVVRVDIGEGPVEEWELTVSGPNGTLTLDREQLVVAVRGAPAVTVTAPMAAQPDDGRPVEDLLRLGVGHVPLGACLEEAACCLDVLDAARALAGGTRRHWLRPRAKALGRLNGSC